MRAVLHALLLAIAFGLELWVLSVCAVAAYRWPDDLVLGVAAAALAPLVMGLLWGLFAAPRARRRLAGISSVAFGWPGSASGCWRPCGSSGAQRGSFLSECRWSMLAVYAW